MATGYVTTDGIDLNEILYGRILPTIDIYNQEEVLDLRAMLCDDWDESLRKFDVSGPWKFKRMGEGAKAGKTKPKYGKRQKDTEKMGLALGYTFDWLMSNEASSQEIQRMTRKAVGRDRALQTAIILQELLQSDTDGWYNGSFSSDENMDSPPNYAANSFNSSHTHVVASGSTTLSLDNITAAKVHLKEHGFGGRIFGFANADFISKIENLAGWAALSQSSFVIPTTVVNEISVEGFRGRLLGVDWKETEWMPDDYFILIGESEMIGEKPITFVEKKNPSAKGLILDPGSKPQYPIIDSEYLHWLAAQVLLRGAGVTYYLASSWSDANILSNVVEEGM